MNPSSWNRNTIMLSMELNLLNKNNTDQYKWKNKVLLRDLFWIFCLFFVFPIAFFSQFSLLYWKSFDQILDRSSEQKILPFVSRENELYPDILKIQGSWWGIRICNTFSVIYRMIQIEFYLAFGFLLLMLSWHSYCYSPKWLYFLSDHLFHERYRCLSYVWLYHPHSCRIKWNVKK